MAKQIKAIAYVRVTKKELATNPKAFEPQKQQILNALDGQNVEIVKWYEHVEGSVDLSFGAMNTYLGENKDVSRVYVTSIDRVGRAAERINRFRADCKYLGVKLRVAGQSTPQERFAKRIMNMAAELNRETHLDSVKSGLQLNKLKRQAKER